MLVMFLEIIDAGLAYVSGRELCRHLVALRPNDHHTHYPRSRCSSTLRRSSSSARHQQPLRSPTESGSLSPRPTEPPHGNTMRVRLRHAAFPWHRRAKGHTHTHNVSSGHIVDATHARFGIGHFRGARLAPEREGSALWHIRPLWSGQGV